MKALRRRVGAFSSAVLLGSFISLAAGAGTLATAAPSIVHAPRIPANGNNIRGTWSASNWSGYAETGTFTGVTSTWTVPSVVRSASPTYSSAWIGVDGFNNSNLIQTGTEEDYYNGAAHYNAWWEILPAPETALPSNYVVLPGNSMKASIYETSSLSGGGGRGKTHGGSQHVWMITIANTSLGWSFSTTQTYSGPGSSAEWVMEAPEVGGHIATLANYTFSPPTGGDFDNAGVLTNPVNSGSSPVYGSAGLVPNEAGVMIQNNVQVSTPSAPDAAKSAFNAAYGPGYTTVPPTAPTS